MKSITPLIDKYSSRPLYLQIYDYVRDCILTGIIVPNEKLPSIRYLAKTTKLSVTTIQQAYLQLCVEGYLYSKVGSGYYANEISQNIIENKGPIYTKKIEESSKLLEQSDYIYDLECFNFQSWKKCINRVFNDFPEQLLTESNPQGEIALRNEISKYVFQSRGVNCSPDNIVIAAGTQTITSLICSLLKLIDIENISVEDPGYKHVINIFKERGFILNYVPVIDEGINIDLLPTNIKSASYINPSNQFPTGAFMPIANRLKMIEWARKNQSYIIEDDYDSELRYIGNPVPSLHALGNKTDRIIYLGSFSSTLFSSIKISYMILPDELCEKWKSIKFKFNQTCSKTEQLALAIFMNEGEYQKGIKKIRALYGKKQRKAIEAFKNHAPNSYILTGEYSGLSMNISIVTKISPIKLINEGRKLGLKLIYNEDISKIGKTSLIFYYNKIPLELIDSKILALVQSWKSIENNL